MYARKALAFLGVLLLSAAAPRADESIVADPHELYEAARDHLRNGELEPAEEALSRLRNLVSRGSEWDPDGVFANQLLPPLQAKLRRMQAVTRELDNFSNGALKALKPPQVPDDVASVRHLTEWTTSVVQELRRQRDQIITAGLPEPEEQAALTRTASYSRTERLLETDVLRSIVDSAGGELQGLVWGDPRVDAVLVRFRKLKQDLMQIMLERSRLEQELKKSQDRDEAQLGALAALVTEGDPAAFQRSPPLVLSDWFAQFLDQELAATRARTTHSSAEHDARRADLDRYRRYNEILSRSGIATDQSGRIQALSQAVEAVPLNDRKLAIPSVAALAHGLLTLALALIAGFTSWLAISRGRRLSSGRSAAHFSRPLTGGKLPGRDVDGHAA